MCCVPWRWRKEQADLRAHLDALKADEALLEGYGYREKSAASDGVLARQAGKGRGYEPLAPGPTEVELARLDNRFTGPPADPLVYGDVVVSRPEGAAWLEAAADADGAAAAGAARAKHSRYPAFALPGGRLVPFSVEAFGRWGSEALDFLRDAAQATCERSPQLAFLGSWGKVALLGAWHGRLSVALQKGNAACLLQAGRVRDAADLAGATAWEEDLEDLLRDAAAAAAAGGLQW